jgi:hypothetical protein
MQIGLPLPNDACKTVHKPVMQQTKTYLPKIKYFVYTFENNSLPERRDESQTSFVQPNRVSSSSASSVVIYHHAIIATARYQYKQRLLERVPAIYLGK